ncbi:MAG: hypothetical protein JRG89_07880 [Deltaproteobacteria bacterium]|nr:hypothetical protein [Deltaproteobacteria bacterium]MBW2388343.1 hypothetical protein [Deltaproteobacteria bacterium]MBW2723188.1 hypothetical protein [Deltaproteobacteria bacterium]
MAEGFSSRALRLGLGLALIGVGSCSSSGGGSGDAACGGGECKLIASDAAVNDIFGLGVALSGDALVVGSPQDDDNGETSGSAYVYRQDGNDWEAEQKLVASDGAEFDRFGGSVAIDGDLIVVGASTAGGVAAGAAYVFRLVGTRWVEEAKLTASDGAADDLFGRAVDVDGDVIVVGAQQADGSGASSGAAYVYRLVAMTWVEENKIVAADAAEGDFFGVSVSVSGDAVLVGATGSDDAGNESGAAYVYRFDGTNWLQEQKILAMRDAIDPILRPGCEVPGPKPDGFARDRFGLSVAIDGDKLAVGADGTEFRLQSTGCNRFPRGNNIGAIYVYLLNAAVWEFEQKLEAPDFEPELALGRSVSLDGDVLASGTKGDRTNGLNAGSAYVFRFDGMEWSSDVTKDKLLASDGVEFDFFGNSIGVSGDSLVVGAYGADDKGPLSGSAYVYGL